MTVHAFLHRIKYKSAECPDHVSRLRWCGMLAWFEKRFKEGYFDEH